MTEPATAACPDCSTAFEPTDNYCRRCGMYLVALRPTQVTTTETQALEPVRAGLPAPMKKAATALAIGTALQIGVGLAGKYLASQGGRQAAVSAAKPLARRKLKGRDIAKQQDNAVSDPMDNAGAISETVIVRRVWIRR